MKQRIVPIVIIVGLIVFFVFVDRKDFNRYNDVQPVQGYNLKSNKKAFSVTTEEMKHVTDEHTTPETKTELETKHEHAEETQLVPFAVPVVTPEEAGRLNQEAIAYASAQKERREPFYRLYEKSRFDSFCFQGTIRATSTIPDPEKNDYDNCLYALFVEIDSLLSEVNSDTKIACEAIVNVPIMKDKEIVQDNKLLPGDRVWCSCTEYDAMPQSIQEIQLSDDIQSYEHQQYFSIEIKKIPSFQKDGNRNFAKREITILPIQTLPKDEKAAALKKERIQNEITRIEEELKKHGGSFEKWKEEYLPVSEKYKQLSSEHFKGWIKDSFFAAEESETVYNTKLYIEEIRPYKEYLENNGIDLILVRIPSEQDFAARVLASNVFQENPAWVEHYYECLKNGIEIIDPMPEMWKHRFDFPLFYFYHVPSDPHPLEGQAFISAKTLSEVLKRYDYSKTDQPITLEDSNFKTTQARFLWPEGNEKFNPHDTIVFKQTNQNGKPIGDLTVNTGSPFLFLSNSFFWYPQRALGASVPGYTAFFLQHIPDWFYQDGSGNEMLRTLISNRDVLSNRKVVIMVGHPRFWNGYGFPKLPKYLLDNATKITLEKTLDLLDDDLLAQGKECYLFTKDDNGYVQFVRDNSIQTTPNASGSFHATISIPPVEGKNTCMIRLNFESNNHLTIDALSENNSLIDTYTLGPGSNENVDLFVPASNETTTVSLRFTSRYTQKYVLRKIELWYY